MMQKAMIQQILDAVRAKPRSIQEIAHLLDKNWRTAERYIDQIAQDTGMIATRTYREGTRGALKIVYWNALEPRTSSAFQENLLQQILRGREKTDFSPFDIYQFVPYHSRSARIFEEKKHQDNPQSYAKLFPRAHEQILLFSGNLSWLHDEKNMERVLGDAIARKVTLKILARVDISNKKDVQRLLAINKRVGRDAIEIRHCAQPLRAAIIDDVSADMKEFFSTLRIPEIKKDSAVYYHITDPEWIHWMQKVFWHLWNESVDATIRIDALGSVHQ